MGEPPRAQSCGKQGGPRQAAPAARSKAASWRGAGQEAGGAAGLAGRMPVAMRSSLFTGLGAMAGATSKLLAGPQSLTSAASSSRARPSAEQSASWRAAGRAKGSWACARPQRKGHRQRASGRASPQPRQSGPSLFSCLAQPALAPAPAAPVSCLPSAAAASAGPSRPMSMTGSAAAP